MLGAHLFLRASLEWIDEYMLHACTCFEATHTSTGKVVDYTLIMKLYGTNEIREKYKTMIRKGLGFTYMNW